MSINMFVRETKLPDVVGRVDYATHPDRQHEKLLAVVGNTDPEFWQHLAADCQATFKPRTHTVRKKDGTIVEVPDKCCEAREYIVMLPNSFMDLPPETQAQKLRALSNYIHKKTGTENVVALHNSHAGKSGPGNVHVHIIIAERRALPTIEIVTATRNLFF